MKETIIVRGSGGTDFSCGKCGAVLLSQVDRPMLLNAALKCNRCGCFSDGGRPAQLAGIPTMSDDLPSLPAPIETFPPLEPWDESLHKPLLDQVHEDFVRRWRAAQGPRPRKLYHYTSLAGLDGILKSHQVWITDVAYLNDSSELRLADTLISARLAAHAESAAAQTKELLKRSAVTNSPWNPSSGHYVACFCEARDSLSQWRAYGANGGGYAIGFSAFEMCVEGLVALRKVVYEPAQQITLVDETIQRVCESFGSVAADRSIEDLDSDGTLPAFSKLLASHLSEFLVTFKDEAFADENEWRIRLPFSRAIHMRHLQFRADKGTSVPYMALHPRTPTAALPVLPIFEVVHGPTLHPELTKKSLHLLLESRGYDFVEVQGSAVPLRV